jgi:hypothetical protein
LRRGHRYTDFVRIYAFIADGIISGGGKIICLSVDEVADSVACYITDVYAL